MCNEHWLYRSIEEVIDVLGKFILYFYFSFILYLCDIRDDNMLVLRMIFHGLRT